MEFLPSLKLILRLWNVRLYYPSWDPFLLLCNSEFLLVDLMHLDAINALTEKLIFKVNAWFLGPQMHLKTMILRFLVNNLNLCLCTWYCLHLTHYIPAYCIIKEQALQNHSVMESFWSSLSSVFWTFFHVKISAVVFFYFFRILEFLLCLHNPGRGWEPLPSLLSWRPKNLIFLHRKAQTSWSLCLDAPQDNPLYPKSFLRGCSQAFTFKTMGQAANLQYMYLWSWSRDGCVRKEWVRKYTEVHRICSSKPVEVEIYLQFNNFCKVYMQLNTHYFPYQADLMTNIHQFWSLLIQTHWSS